MDDERETKRLFWLTWLFAVLPVGPLLVMMAAYVIHVELGWSFRWVPTRLTFLLAAAMKLLSPLGAVVSAFRLTRRDADASVKVVAWIAVAFAFWMAYGPDVFSI